MLMLSSMWREGVRWNRSSRRRWTCSAAKLQASEACVWHECHLCGRAAVQTVQPSAGSVTGELEQQESSGQGRGRILVFG